MAFADNLRLVHGFVCESLENEGCMYKVENQPGVILPPAI